VDGDIPCTPETEPSYAYTWNFCADVTKVSVPKACSDLGKTAAVALQSFYLQQGGELLEDCYIIGHYDPSQDDLYYGLIDQSDPSKGVTMTYPSGEKCKTSGKPRSATIDVVCANTRAIVVSATENTECQYHLIVKSYHGCPTVRCRSMYPYISCAP
jgi:Glucosidase II beta subunit-like protein